MPYLFAAAPRRLLLAGLLASAALLPTACQKDEPAVAADFSATDESLIKAYVSTNGLTTAQRQTSGLYYVPVLSNPTGTRAEAKKTVSVLYTGRLLSGAVFDASSLRATVPFTFALGTGQVIAGWDEGIALMRKGEKAKLLVPSALGYKGQTRGSIPANSVLVFDVEVTDVQ